MSSTTAKKPHSAPRKRPAKARKPKEAEAPKVIETSRIEQANGKRDSKQLERMHLRIGLKYATWLHQQAAFPSKVTMSEIVEQLIDAEMRKADK